MRTTLLFALALIALSACQVTTTSPTSTAPPTPTATKPKPVASAPARSLDAQIRTYRAVAARVQPVAEQICRATHAKRPASFCQFRVKVINNPKQAPNAFQTIGKDGRPIVAFNSNMLLTVQSRDEIAFILGHEFGHQIASHLIQKVQNQRAGAILGGILVAAAGGNAQLGVDIGAQIGARSFSQKFELQADRLGTHISARAGFDPIRGSVGFDANKAPRNVLSTHPPSAQRRQTVRATYAEIQAARAKGQTAPVRW